METNYRAKTLLPVRPLWRRSGTLLCAWNKCLYTSFCRLSTLLSRSSMTFFRLNVELPPFSCTMHAPWPPPVRHLVVSMSNLWEISFSLSISWTSSSWDCFHSWQQVSWSGASVVSIWNNRHKKLLFSWTVLLPLGDFVLWERERGDYGAKEILVYRIQRWTRKHKNLTQRHECLKIKQPSK